VGRKISGKPIYGIGINNGKYPANQNREQLREYKLWVEMLRRCTPEYPVKYPTYLGTTCSNNFKSYSFFYEWCHEQVGFNNKDEYGRSWQLDKDILFKGNKHYSEETCVFVPHRINCMLIKANKARGNYPIGVCWWVTESKYVAECRDGKKAKRLGTYNTPEEAFKAYKLYKECLIKQVAEQYRCVIDTRTYQALIDYEVEILD
jgi:hypothetical protein